MAKQKHYVYLSARKMDPGQVMSSGYGLLSYDQPLSKVVMDGYSLTDVSKLPEQFLKGLGAFL